MGRNGTRHYDNRTTRCCRRCAAWPLFGEHVDPWQVSTDVTYHESGLLNGESRQPLGCRSRTSSSMARNSSGCTG